jgi:hypothetical protein
VVEVGEEPQQPPVSTPEELRRRIATITKDIIIPYPSKKFPKGEIHVKASTLRSLDMLAFLGGFRIDEICGKAYGNANTSHTLTLKEDTYRATGEPVLLIRVNALKKKVPTLREIGIPLGPKHEPFAQPLLDAWNNNGCKPFKIDRYTAYRANRIVFADLEYRIKPRIVYRRDKNRNLIRDKNGKKITEKIVPEHSQGVANHGIRHIRTNELRNRFQLTREERTAFYRWSTMNLEGAAVMDEYDQPEWFEFFPKLLTVKNYV